MSGDLDNAWSKRAMASKLLDDKAKELSYVGSLRRLPEGVGGRFAGCSFDEIYVSATTSERSQFKYASVGWGDAAMPLQTGQAGKDALAELCNWMDAKDEWFRRQKDLSEKPLQVGQAPAASPSAASSSAAPVVGQALVASSSPPACSVASSSMPMMTTLVAQAPAASSSAAGHGDPSVFLTVSPDDVHQFSVAPVMPDVPEACVSPPPSKRARVEAAEADTPVDSPATQPLSSDPLSLVLPVLHRP